MPRKTKAQLRMELERIRARLHHASAARDGATARSPSCVEIELRKCFPIAELEQEHFWAVLLTSRQKVLCIHTAAVGSLSRVDVHPRDIFREAVRLNAHAVIVAHNHPSQNPEPSPADLALTERFVHAGELLGVPVLDHLILTAADCYSCAALGLMPSPS